MALNIVFLSVVLRKEHIQQQWPQGLEGFNRQYPDCASDDSLILSAFMSYGETLTFVRELRDAGIDDGEIAVVDQFRGWQQKVNWLDLVESPERLCCQARSQD